MNYPDPEFTDQIIVTQDGVSAEFTIRENTNDGDIVREVWNQDWYQFYTNNIGMKIKRGMNVLDVGGHIGSFSILAAKKGAKVTAFEPEPANYKLFEHNRRQNNLNKITCLNMAVNSQGGRRELALNDHNTGAHSIEYDRGDLASVEVDSARFEDIVREMGEVHVAKLDCEGSEHDIINNSAVAVWKYVGSVVMELHGTKKTMPKFLKDYTKFFRELGFEHVVTNYAEGTEQGRLHALRNLN